MTDIVERLLPCPFCGGEPKCNGLPNGITGQIYCDSEECFGPRTTALTKQDSIVQWNTRAQLSAPADGKQAGAAVAWLVPSDETGFCRIWWRDKERAEAWLAKHPTCTLVPLYAAPPHQAAMREALEPCPVCGSKTDEWRCGEEGCPRPSGEHEIIRLKRALQEIMARTYSTDRRCRLEYEPVAEICDITRAALSAQSDFPSEEDSR